EEVAKLYIDKFKSVKHAIFAIISKIDDSEDIDKVLSKFNGNIKEALKYSMALGDI
ncbi:MAG TPA: N-acetylmuramic acid 6-phosphate etherase, partial [Acholeplasmataceae bacterium]|nr:N-acetylmuramic acid 6-phosphate etherase [Acholeplasmataceae bacterium]